MITGPDALSKSLQKYCYNGLFCIASGDGKTFTRYYLSEQVPFFDVTDQSFWLLDKSCKPEPKPIEPEDTGCGGIVQDPPPDPDEGDQK